jgi:EVE domain
MAPRYWIGVVHLAQARAAQAAGFVAMSHGIKAAVAKLSVADRVIFYAPKTDFDGDPVQAFVALLTVTGETVQERPLPGTDFRPFTREALYQEVNEVPVRPLLDHLSFVTSPRHWGMAFRRSKFKISQADFSLISEGMAVT